jgi:hypothetical protein
MSQGNQEEQHWLRKKLAEALINNAISLLFLAALGLFLSARSRLLDYQLFG